jgi:hypothetical protein
VFAASVCFVFGKILLLGQKSTQILVVLYYVTAGDPRRQPLAKIVILRDLDFSG